MTAETYERVREIVAKHLGISVEGMQPDSTLEELGVDSLGALELIFRIEEEFNIAVPNERAAGFKNIREICDGIESLKTASPAPTTAS